MIPSESDPIVVGEPNWLPLEMALTNGDCHAFMYMGCIGEIELYKHRGTRRYLNISSDGQHFYRRIGSVYVEISKAYAIDYVFS